MNEKEIRILTMICCDFSNLEITIAMGYKHVTRIYSKKQELIKKIQECDNPFYIFCSDRDGGYNVTEDKLFNLD